jgi:diphosphoinositol-polyphosphate diphosphatase
MHVTEEMAVWPEQSTRTRTWCEPRDAMASCKHEWMRDALQRWGGKFHPELDLGGAVKVNNNNIAAPAAPSK